MKVKTFALLAATIPATLLALGCLIKEEIHTLYLTPEGSVIWTVLEKDVRSDSDDPEVARREEQEFLDRSRTGDQPTASDLNKLSPDSLRTWVLRDERPFSVMTEARFASAEDLARAILVQAELQGDAELQTDGIRTRLVVKVYPPPEEDAAASDAEDPESGDRAEDKPDSPDVEDDELATLLKGYKILLTRGKFVESHGFRLSGNRQEAYPQLMTVKDQGDQDGALVYSLTWETGGAR